MGIRARTILVIISTNFVIIILGILAGRIYVKGRVEDYIEADMLVVADIADRFISSDLDALRDEAADAASSLAGADPADWTGILEAQASQYPKFTGMSALGRQGEAAASAGQTPASPAILENESVQRAFLGETAFTSTVPTDGGVALYLSAPIPGAPDHILVLTMDGAYFSDLVSQYKIWETGHIFIDDNEGYVIANIRPEWVQNRQNFIIQSREDPQYEQVAGILTKASQGGRGIGYYSMDEVSRICAYRPVSGSAEGWFLGIVAPLSESPINDIDRGFFLIATICCLLNFGAAVVTSNFIKKPFLELAALRESAEADSQAKSNFLAHMSHEIRTPLNAVVGLSELMLDSGELGGEAEDKLEKIHNSGMTILSIVNDILDISKIESGRFEMYPTQYDTPSLINDVVTLNIVRIGEKPVTFRLYLDENLPGTLLGDDLRVKQVFNNLLSNAFKYTEAGTVEWRLAFEREGDSVWLVSSVRDTGIGIKPEDVQKLFADYYQVDKTTNRKVEGTGLGLAITKRLVGMMDGTITVESEYGKGTAFYLRLRQEAASDLPIGKAVADSLMNLRYTLSKRDKIAKLARINLSYASVLVVDDVVTNLDVVRGMLNPYKLKIDCVVSGPQAIEMIRAENPRYSAVFMDHMMPGMDGVEAARIIREEIGTDYARNIPIIALTANAISGSEEMFLSKGFQAFISKPIDIIKLDAVLRRWVRDKALEQEAGEGQKTSESRYMYAGGVDLLSNGIAIKGIDLRRALECFGGDELVFVDVLRSYAINTRSLLSGLREYIAEENMEEYAIVIHGIKGSSYGICAQETGGMAERLEAAAKAGDIDAVRRGHAAFEEAAGDLLDEIDKALYQIDGVACRPLAAEPDPALLAELREACEAFNMDRVDDAMARLEAFRYERGRELIDWLREQVNGMVFEEIINLDLSDLSSFGLLGGQASSAGFTAPGAKVLIAEDNETNLKAALGLLRPLAMDIDTARNGEEALHMIQKKRYHIIFMDYRMPVMDGAEAAKRLRRMQGAYYQNVPVIALTADGSDGAKEELTRAGVNDLVAKPIQMRDICDKLLRWLPETLLQKQTPRGQDAEKDASPLPVIEGIDSREGVRHAGSTELFISLLGDFYRLIDLKAARMEQLLADGFIRDFTIEAHALCTTARLIGAGALSEGFARLERYGNEGDTEALAREAPAVLGMYKSFKPALEPFAETAGQEKREASKEELAALLKKLKAAMDEFDLDSADLVAKQLQGIAMPEHLSKPMELLLAYMADVATLEVMEQVDAILAIIE